MRGAAARAPVDEADVVVVNTCSVTATADQGARQTLRRVHRVNPEAQVVATGCYASRDPRELLDLPGSATVVPNDERSTGVVDHVLSGVETTADRFGDGPGACGALVSPGNRGARRLHAACADGL